MVLVQGCLWSVFTMKWRGRDGSYVRGWQLSTLVWCGSTGLLNIAYSHSCTRPLAYPRSFFTMFAYWHAHIASLSFYVLLIADMFAYWHAHICAISAPRIFFGFFCRHVTIASASSASIPHRVIHFACQCFQTLSSVQYKEATEGCRQAAD